MLPEVKKNKSFSTEKTVQGIEPFEQILPVLAGGCEPTQLKLPQRNQWQSSCLHQQNTTLFICRKETKLLLLFLCTECLGKDWLCFGKQRAEGR